MYVVIAGGGHMGRNLVTRLAAEGHEIVVVEISPEVAQRIFAEQGVVAITGSATDLEALDLASIKRADVAVAMTGRDADNLVFCLLARHFGVPRVLARMLDPRYEVAYRLVGATKVHSESEILVESFLTSIDYPQIGALMRIHRQGGLPVSDISKEMGTTLAATSQMVDRLVQQGLITRSEDPNDRRVRQIALTERGRTVLEASLRARQKWVDDLTGSLTHEELETVTNAVRILIKRARAIDPAPES